MIIHFNEKLNSKIRVFISSTFRDMQAERNVIVNGVFPRLRREFKNYNIDIMEVDLRWGITEQDIANMTLLEICISETINCIPYFVGLVGDYYGTIAQEAEIRRLPPAYKMAIGMLNKDDLPIGVSLTELEMRAGAFVKGNKEFARFFIREGGRDTSSPEALRALKEKIRNDGFEYFKYKTTEDFERTVYDELRHYIDKNKPKELEPPYNDRHYLAHLRFLKKTSDVYVPNEEFISGVEREIEREGCVYLYGEKGAGKTSCFCHLIVRDGVERDGDVFFHFADADEESLNQDNLFHRLRHYFESALSYVSLEQDDYDAVIDVIKNNKVDKPISLYFDAIEKYGDNSLLNKLFSLSRFNHSIRVICSGAMDYKQVIGGRRITIAPLFNEQIRQITQRALNNYGKKLEEGWMERLYANPCCKNPLYLTALLSQLITYGHHETFGEFFDRLMRAGGFDELFRIIIERMCEHFTERGFDAGKIYPALALIAYSNAGVKESELGEIVDFLPIEKSVFLATIELFITENDCMIRFNHDLILRTVTAMLEESGTDYRCYAAKSFIDFFTSETEGIGFGSWRAYSEKPYQLASRGVLGELERCLLDKDCFIYLAKNQFNNLVRYMSALITEQEHFINILIPTVLAHEAPLVSQVLCEASCYRAAIMTICYAIGFARPDRFNPEAESSPELLAKHIRRAPLDDVARVRLFAIASRSYYKLAYDHYKNAVKMYEHAVAFYRETYPDDEVGIVTQLYLLGVTYKSQGRVDKALETLSYCTDVCNRHNIKNGTSSWIMAVYANNLLTFGRVDQAKESFKRAIDDNLFLFGSESGEVAWSYSYAWAGYYSAGERNTAIKMARDAYAIYNATYNENGTKIAWAASNLGSCEHISGRYSEAERLYELSITQNDIVLKECDRPHAYSLTTYSNLAILRTDEGKRDEAVSLIEFAKKHSINKNGYEHMYTANIILIEGILKSSPSLIEDAIRLFERQGTPDVWFAKVCYARVLSNEGEWDSAAAVASALYREYLDSSLNIGVIGYLIFDTVEKVCFDADIRELRERKETLNRFREYKYYVPFNNSSALIPIPYI